MKLCERLRLRHPREGEPRAFAGTRRGPMLFSHLTPAPCQWFSRLASALDRRSAARLAWLFLGALLARGRRAVTSRIRAAGSAMGRRAGFAASQRLADAAKFRANVIRAVEAHTAGMVRMA